MGNTLSFTPGDDELAGFSDEEEHQDIYRDVEDGENGDEEFNEAEDDAEPVEDTPTPKRINGRGAR